MLTAAELDRVYVVLVASRNPLNIGAAARAMSNFGFARLRVVRPFDVAFREARSAVDAEPVLQAAEEFDQVADAVADCSLVVGTMGGGPRNPAEPLERLETAAESVREQLRSGGQVAILFGSEKVGLSNLDLSHCQLLLRIPTRTEHPSMNLGQAVAVVLYELMRQEEPVAAVVPGAAGRPLATAGERERLISVLLEATEMSGTQRRSGDRSPEDRIRRLVLHLPLTSADLNEWLGLVRHLLWKLRAAPSSGR